MHRRRDVHLHPKTLRGVLAPGQPNGPGRHRILHPLALGRRQLALTALPRGTPRGRRGRLCRAGAVPALPSSNGGFQRQPILF